MKHYSKWTVAKVRDLDIRDFIPDFNKRKPSEKVECPFCQEKQLGAVYRVRKGKLENYAHCFHCDRTISGAIAAVEAFEGLKFPESLEYAAKAANIVLETEENEAKSRIEEAKLKAKESFLEKQLKESGLTVEDTMATVVGADGVEVLAPTMVKGGVTDRFAPIDFGDEMIIYYYDQYGRQVMYSPSGAKGLKPYFRVRWNNPALHEGKNGKAGKYMSPPGSKSCAYIPEPVRRAFLNKEHIETLFVQEGEKKALKACKHGILSIGIQGIGNFGSKEAGLLSEIQEICKVCTVRNIVLLMDSDWDDLNKNITVGEEADYRQKMFASAVKRFRQQCMTFAIIGLNIDVWWGHVNTNEQGDKGIDDLLCNTLAGKEEELTEDIRVTMLSHNGKGKYVDIHKITTLSDTKINEFWSLGDNEAFYKRHEDKLKELSVFKIGFITYKLVDGKLTKMSMLSSDRDIWTVQDEYGEKPKVVFNPSECFEMLQNSGFRRIYEKEASDGTSQLISFDWVRIENNIISFTAPSKIRDFVMEYVMATSKSKIIRDFFYSSLDTKLSDKKLERLATQENESNEFCQGVQSMNFNNGAVTVTESEIKDMQPYGLIWRSQIIPRKFRRIKIFESVDLDESGKWQIVPTKEGEQCEFLSFLSNTSNMAYGPTDAPVASPQQDSEYRQHLMNKLTAIGYLLTDYKYEAERVAIVCQDATMAEVGQSSGGTGKSIFGLAIGNVINQTVIDGKQEIGDRFAFMTVDRSTRNVFIDDVRVNFDFEIIYNFITGNVVIQRKAKEPIVIKKEKTPKILITTNHAINKATSPSTARRIVYCEFSSWYGREYTPQMDFGHELFTDWDEHQWALFDNLMAECIMLYQKSRVMGWSSEGRGIVLPPMQNIMQRTLRQSIGETFISWAEEYFSEGGVNVRNKIRKNAAKEDFFNKNGRTGHGVTDANFTRHVMEFVRFRGWSFNPSRPDKKGVCYRDFKKKCPNEPFFGVRDSSNSIEYYEILPE